MDKTLTIMVSLIVAGVVFAASLPVLEAVTSSEEGVHNEGAGWVRFGLNRTANAEYTINIVVDEELDTFSIVNGTDTQTYDSEGSLDFETILYADSNASVWVDEDAIHILGTSNGSPFYVDGWGNLDIVRNAEGVSIGYNDFFVSFGVPTWAYVPISTGSYGFFMNGTEVTTYPNDMPLAIVGGGFAGVYAYNDIYRYDGLGLSMTVSRTEDDLLNGASWSKAAPEVQSIEPFDPSSITLDPLDPSVLDPSILDPGAGSVGLMSVPTPTYTDGYWGYDLTTIGGIQKAIIVSYSGSGGDVIVPATVGGYPVHRLGKIDPSSGTQNEVFDNSSLSANSTLTITEGIKEIGAYALRGCSNFTGSLELPNSITDIGRYSFSGCTGFNGPLVIPDSVIHLYRFAFSDCSGFTSLELPDSLILLEQSTFRNCTGLTGTLKIPESLTNLEAGTFYATGFTGTLVIPDSIISLGTQTFLKCTGFHSVVIPNSVTNLGGPFSQCTFTNLIVMSDATPSGTNYPSTVTSVLDLSDVVEYTAGSYGISSDAVVSSDIGACFGYVAPVDVTVPSNDGVVADLLNILPIVMGAGMILVAIGMFIWRRM